MSETEIRQLTTPPPICAGCEIESCWVIADRSKRTVKRCPTYGGIYAKIKIKKMLLSTRRDFVRIPTFADLEYNRNNIKDKVKKINEWVNSGSNFIFIISSNGTGKTHILLSLLYDILTAGKSGYYIESTRLRDIWANQAKGEMTGDQCMELAHFIDAEYKFIDEIGGEGESLFFEKKMAELLNRYYDRFVLASNLDPEGKREQKLNYQDNRLLDRLRQAVTVKWRGVSYREKIKLQED